MDTQKLYEETMAKRVKKNLEFEFGRPITAHPDKDCEECTKYHGKNVRREKKNDYFAQLLAEELQELHPCMRIRCFIRILNFVNTIKNNHSHEIEVTDSERM